MKLFHISDVLTVTTGRLVSNRHMQGVYEILNFLTGDELYTHQLPRAMRECEPWLRKQFPWAFADTLLMSGLLSELDSTLEKYSEKQDRSKPIAQWVESVRQAVGVPEYLPVYEMGADMHTRIDPVEEAKAMVGDDHVIAIQASPEAQS